jgi:O-acetyl-ADP-ribose deacetylase (regulator of RNase III)
MNQVLTSRQLAGGQEIALVQGDITEETTEAIVNAANSYLQHGAGVAGAISRRGGPRIQQESDRWVREHGPVSHARPAWTSGGQLPAKYVIHAVGPIWGDGQEDEKLAAAVRGALSVAEELKVTSLSLPAISTGIFGFPKRRAAHIILRSIESYFARHSQSGIRQVRIVLLDAETIEAFLKTWEETAK